MFWGDIAHLRFFGSQFFDGTALVLLHGLPLLFVFLLHGVQRLELGLGGFLKSFLLHQ